MQMAARKLRYDWFLKIINLYKYDYLIIGHHLDDSIETLFINLFRGSGIYGLKGINKLLIFKKKKILRPFINFKIKKKQILNYANKNKIKWINDVSNLKNIYFRNKIRNKIIPFLEQNIFNFKKKIIKTLNNINLEYNFIKEIITYYTKKIFVLINIFIMKL
ncbi:MAG: tRNA lysidine(34) synthetase TilS [Candidatus Shikimatogenerans bostrichidophilus]|nr:MAG: tRNA lysidine(34) synthetase TilS [Candidatus Shikimatogenerans bostrichidophilus]